MAIRVGRSSRCEGLLRMAQVEKAASKKEEETAHR